MGLWALLLWVYWTDIKFVIRLDEGLSNSKEFRHNDKAIYHKELKKHHMIITKYLIEKFVNDCSE